MDVERFARPLTRRPDNIQDMSAQVLEEYILETAERSQPGSGTGGTGASSQTRVYHTRLTILQRQATEEYIGELYVERDFKVYMGSYLKIKFFLPLFSLGGIYNNLRLVCGRKS